MSRLVFLFVCTMFTQQSFAYTFAQLYRDKIQYQNFYQIDWSRLSDISLPVPNQMKNRIAAITTLDQKYETLFQIWVQDQIRNRHISNNDLASMQPFKLLNLAISIVTEALVYADVDSMYHPVPSYAVCLKIGKGDCDKYTDSLIKVFHWLKAKNGLSKNVYVADAYYGGNFAKHAWNTVFLFFPDRLVVSQIDLTWYDEGQSLSAEDNYYRPKDYNLWLANFYFAADEYFQSQHYYNLALDTALKADPSFVKEAYVKEVQELVFRQDMYFSCQMNKPDEYLRSMEKLSHLSVKFRNTNLASDCDKLFKYYKNRESTPVLSILHNIIFQEQIFELINRFYNFHF